MSQGWYLDAGFPYAIGKEATVNGCMCLGPNQNVCMCNDAGSLFVAANGTLFNNETYFEGTADFGLNNLNNTGDIYLDQTHSITVQDGGLQIYVNPGIGSPTNILSVYDNIDLGLVLTSRMASPANVANLTISGNVNVGNGCYCVDYALQDCLCLIPDGGLEESNSDDDVQLTGGNLHLPQDLYFWSNNGHSSAGAEIHYVETIGAGNFVDSNASSISFGGGTGTDFGFTSYHTNAGIISNFEDNGTFIAQLRSGAGNNSFGEEGALSATTVGPTPVPLITGTGSDFAVLPPENATGNWVKVVQRLPVRLELDSLDPDHPLFSGISATVRVDTGYRRTWRHPFRVALVTEAVK